VKGRGGRGGGGINSVVGTPKNFGVALLCDYDNDDDDDNNNNKDNFYGAVVMT